MLFLLQYFIASSILFMQVIKPGGVNGFGMRIVMKIPSQSLYSYFIVQAYVMISLQMNYYRGRNLTG